VRRYETQFDAESSRACVLSPVEAFKRDVILGLWLLSVNLPFTAAKYGVNISVELNTLLGDLHNSGHVEYCDGTLSLEEHHRFGAGEVMRRLANLSTHKWTAEPHSEYFERSPFSSDSYNSTASLIKALGPIIRMARLDSKLFNALQMDPSATLQSLGYNTSDNQMQALIDVIYGIKSPYLYSDTAKLQHIWSAIEQEHSQSR
jgi:hypothetical protein